MMDEKAIMKAVRQEIRSVFHTADIDTYISVMDNLEYGIERILNEQLGECVWCDPPEWKECPFCGKDSTTQPAPQEIQDEFGYLLEPAPQENECNCLKDEKVHYIWNAGYRAGIDRRKLRNNQIAKRSALEYINSEPLGEEPTFAKYFDWLDKGGRAQVKTVVNNNNKQRRL